MMGIRKQQSEHSDELAVAGGVDLPSHLVRITANGESVPTDELSQRLFALMALHPEVELNFRADDIANMDDSTKSLLISDVQRVLDIAELKADTL